MKTRETILVWSRAREARAEPRDSEEMWVKDPSDRRGQNHVYLRKTSLMSKTGKHHLGSKCARDRAIESTECHFCKRQGENVVQTVVGDRTFIVHDHRLSVPCEGDR